jgi:sugar lactone lactonase YvrE
MRLDPATGAVTPHLERHALERFKGLNDLVFARNGDLYFTDQGLTGLHDPTGRLYCLRADGRLERLLDNIPSPNGLVLSLDESTIYLNVTRDNAVWRVPLLPDGSAFKVGAFIRLSGGGGPDGLAVIADTCMAADAAAAGVQALLPKERGFAQAVRYLKGVPGVRGGVFVVGERIGLAGGVEIAG